MPRNEIAGLYDSSIFSFFEETPYYFPQWLHQFALLPTIFKGSLFSRSSQILVVFLMTVILTCMRWYLIEFLIFIFLINGVEHLFTCLLVICLSLTKCPFKSSTHFSVISFANFPPLNLLCFCFVGGFLCDTTSLSLIRSLCCFCSGFFCVRKE